jgi:ankyrin repeat protein
VGRDPGDFNQNQLRDKDKATPLHYAAFGATDMKIIDLLLENIKDEDIDQYKKDATLLCYAYCNEQHKLGGEIVDRLNQKGMARIQVLQNPKVLDELNAIKQSLSNEHGPAAQVANLLKRIDAAMAKPDRGQHQPNPHIQQSTFEKIREMKTRKAEVGSIAHTIGDNTLNMRRKVGQMSQAALRLAIENSDVEKVRNLFKEFGADFITKATWGEYEMNALHVASLSAKTTEILDVILETGKFDINGLDNNGWTPLHCAIIGSNAVTNARYLLEKGADPTMGDNKGHTPFHMAASFSRKTNILDFILVNNNQFDIDHRNQFGMTALHTAIMKSNTATAEFLLSKGANPNAADQHGYTPLHVAAVYAKDKNIIELLVSHKDVNVNYLDNNGHSALDYAMSNAHGLGV